MALLLDSLWRAAMYCLHPRVIALSVLPLLLMVVLAFGAGYLFWESAVAGVQAQLESLALVETFLAWLDAVGISALRSVLAPLVVVFLALPVIAIVSLLAVAWLMTPAMVDLVAQRRFADLERRQGGSALGSLAWSFGSTLLALIALVLSVPLWLIPPLVLVLPPLIWGWLTYRVMTYDALSSHATVEERRAIFREHRMRLLGIGVLTGYLGAAPGLLWASSAMMIAMAPLLVPLAIWIYTLVFAFSSLWFTHYVLAALQQRRGQLLAAGQGAAPPAVPGAGVDAATQAAAPVALAHDPSPSNGTPAPDVPAIR